ncbi:MAG: winged helix DNA-binding domain-containing protein [Iamia sp.]
MITDREIARWRLHSQHLAGAGLDGATDVVSHLLGVQAENYGQASWAVATRTTGLTEADFAQVFDAGDILRTHVLRPTWHFVDPNDIRWLLDLTAPRIRARCRALQRELDLDDAELDRAAGHVVEALTPGTHLTRAALGERLAEEGLPSEGRELGLIAAHAELSGLICSGAVQDGHHTYALLDGRAPEARRLDRDEALAELALRYVSGHGPATARDLAYWATLTLTDARKGLAAVADALGSFDHDGRTFWFATSDPGGPIESRAHLLQIFDESYRGYQDSRRVLDADGHLPPGREASVGTVLIDGQYAGTMRRTLGASTVTFEVSPCRDLDRSELSALQDAAARYGRFLGLAPEVSLEGPATATG